MATNATTAGTIRAGSLEDLYERTAPAALRLAYFVSGDRDLAQDLVQEAFARVAGRFHHLRKPDAFEAYLRRTIVNLFTSHLRHRRIERAYLEVRRGDPPPDHAIPDVAERDRTSYRSAEFGLASVASIAVTDGEVWIAGGFPLGGPPAIARFDGVTWALVSEGLEGSGQEPVELTTEGGAFDYTRVVAGRGEIWATTWAGLYRSGLTVAGPPRGRAAPADGAGELWIDDRIRDGVWRLQGDRWTHFGANSGVPGGWGSLLATEDGTVWVSGSGGLASIDAAGWRRVDTEEHRALALGPDGEAWTAITPGRDRGQPGTVVGPVSGTPIPEPAPVYPVGTLLVSSDADVWIGSGGDWGPNVPGLAHYDGTGWTLVTPIEGEPDFYVSDIELDLDGDVWVSLAPCCRSGSDARPSAWSRGSTGRRGAPSAPPRASPRTGAAISSSLPDGTMLLASGSGLFQFRDDALTLVQEGWFDDVSIAPDGTVWLAGDGLFRLPNA